MFSCSEHVLLWERRATAAGYEGIEPQVVNRQLNYR